MCALRKATLTVAATLLSVFVAADPARADGDGTSAPERRLQRIVVPEVDLRDAALGDVFDFLVAAGRGSTASGAEPVSFALSLSPDERARTITLKGTDVTLLQILRAVVRLGDIGYHVQGNLIIVGDRAAPAEPVMRAYSVPATLAAAMRKRGAKQYLSELGVPFPEGAAARYNSAAGKLIVVNTPKNIRVLEQVLPMLGVGVRGP